MHMLEFAWEGQGQGGVPEMESLRGAIVYPVGRKPGCLVTEGHSQHSARAGRDIYSQQSRDPTVPAAPSRQKPRVHLSPGPRNTLSWKDCFDLHI